MKRTLKASLLFVMLVILIVLVLVPVESYSKVTYSPGIKTGGPYGDTCECPHSDYNCGCTIIEERE